MKLFFENRFGEEQVISTPETLEAAFKDIIKFLKENHFEMYYCREMVNRADKSITYDVGSHTEFFHLRDIPDDILQTLPIN